MSLLLSDQSRLLALFIAAILLWCVESQVPLYRYERHRLRRALPNIGFTVLLILTNLALSVVTASVANFANSKRLGLFSLLATPTWLTAVRHYGVGSVYIFRARFDA